MADTQNLSSGDEHWMTVALEQAHLASSRGEVPVGAVIVRNDTIISAAHNLRESLADPTAHAELLAIRHAATLLRSWRLENCTLYVTLEPCPMCAGAIVNARLPRVVYGTTDPKMGCVDTLHKLCTDERFNHRVSITSGVLADQCGQVLRDFFVARRSSVKPPKPQI
jgi:tRNA(adenine34) deaminase